MMQVLYSTPIPPCDGGGTKAQGRSWEMTSGQPKAGCLESVQRWKLFRGALKHVDGAVGSLMPS